MTDKLVLKALKCSNCGADVQFLPGLDVSVCGYCGSNFERASEAREVSVEAPDLLAPFRVNNDTFLKAIRGWLSEGAFTPDDVLTAEIETKGTYLPFYAWSGEYKADWFASSGYDRQEEYIEMQGDKLVKKHRKVTDWRPSNGVINGRYLIYTLASDSVDPELTAFCEEAPASSAVSFETEQLAGFTLEPFDKDSSEFAGRVEDEIERIAASVARPRIPGDRWKDLNCSTTIVSQDCVRVYLPFWLTTFLYGRQPFRCVVDGCNAARIKGTRPVDPDRINRARRMMLPGKLALIGAGVSLVLLPMLGMQFLAGAHKWIVLGLLGASMVFGIAGSIARSVMLARSKKLRQRLLAEMNSK